MSDLIFFAGGECLERFGTLVWRQSEAQDVPETHTRSGTVGPSVTPSGSVIQADANVPRIEWDSGEAYLLLELANTNLVTDDNASTGWIDNGTGQSISTGVVDPFGGTGAYTITGDGSKGLQGKYNTTTFTSDAAKSAVFVVKEATMPATGDQSLWVYDSNATAERLRLNITGWTNGEPTIEEATGTYLGKRSLPNGFWAIYGKTTVVASTNINSAFVWSNISASSASITFYRANVYDEEFPGYSILDANATRNADTFYADFPYKPQEMTVYVKFTERGAIAQSAGGNKRILHIGDSDGTADPRLFIYANGGTSYRIQHDNGTSAVSASSTAAPAFDDTVEIRGVLNADGSVVLGTAYNGGTEAITASNQAAALGSSWSNQRTYLNSVGGSQTNVANIRSIKVAKGVQTMRAMRNL